MSSIIIQSVPSRYPVRFDETDNDESDLVAYDCGAYDEQPDLAVNERIGALDSPFYSWYSPFSFLFSFALISFFSVLILFKSKTNYHHHQQKKKT